MEPGSHSYPPRAYLVAQILPFWNTPESRRTMGFPLLQLGMHSPYFWLLSLSSCEFPIACCTPLVSVLFMVVSPGSRTVPTIIGAQYIHAELIKCMTLPRMFPCQLLNTESPSPYLFLLSAKPDFPQLLCHWALFTWFWLQSSSSPFSSLLSSHPLASLSLKPSLPLHPPYQVLCKPSVSLS